MRELERVFPYHSFMRDDVGIPKSLETVRIDNTEDLLHLFRRLNIPYRGRYKQGFYTLMYHLNVAGKPAFYLGQTKKNNLYCDGVVCVIHLLKTLII